AGADPDGACEAPAPARPRRPAGRAPSSRTPRSCPAPRHACYQSRERARQSPAVTSRLHVARDEPSTGGDYIALAREQGRGNHGTLAEAVREPVDHWREPFAAHGVGIEEGELAHASGPETPGRQADEAHRARHSLAVQEAQRPAVELEPVLRRLPGGAPRVRFEGCQAKLERDARRREAPVPQLGGDPFGLGSQRRPEELGVRRVGGEGFLGADRFRKAEGLDGTGITAEGEVVQVLAVLPEAPGQHGARNALESADRRAGRAGRRGRSASPSAPRSGALRTTPPRPRRAPAGRRPRSPAARAIRVSRVARPTRKTHPYRHARSHEACPARPPRHAWARPMSGATGVRAPMMNAMCASRSTPSSVAPR